MHCAATAVALKRHERANAFNLVTSVRQVVVTPPSIVNDDDDDVAAVSTVQPDLFLVSVDGQGSQAGRDDRRKVREAAAAVRRQRRSNYDNVEVEEDRNDEEEDGGGGGQPSRRTTVSSAKTEYSPPWDADRWKFLVHTADRQLRGDDVRDSPFCDGDAQRTGTLERPDQVRRVV